MPFGARTDNVPRQSQFVGQIGASSKMLMMFLKLTKSLGHVCRTR